MLAGWLVAGSVMAVEPGESARLNAWFEARFQDDLERSPMAKTYQGVIDDDYGEWDDLSPGFQDETYRIGQQQLDDMRAQFNVEELDPQTRLSWKLFEYDKLQDQAGHAYRDHAYTFNQMNGVQSQIHRLHQARLVSAMMARRTRSSSACATATS
jgi:hypothetical protein